MYLIRLVVLKRPGFQSQKYGMYLRLLVRLLHNAMLRVHSSTLQYSSSLHELFISALPGKISVKTPVTCPKNAIPIKLMQESYIYIRRAYILLLENHKYNTIANPKCMGLLRVVRKQHGL